MKNEPDFFPIQSLSFDPDLQIRVKINEETIALYAEQMATEEEMKSFPPIEVFYDGSKYWLADGHHRRAAAEKAGHDKVWAIIKSGTRADALWGAILGNGKQGIGLTRADKQRAILLAIAAWPERSNNSIADAIGCGESTVRRYREQKSGSPNGEPDTRKGKDGKEYPAKQKSRSNKSDKKQESPEKEQPQQSDTSIEAMKSETAEQQTDGQPKFRPGSLPKGKYIGNTQLKPIPRDRPDILVSNLIAFFPQEFVPNTAREVLRQLHERYGKDISKPLARELWEQYGRGK